MKKDKPRLWTLRRPRPARDTRADATPQAATDDRPRRASDEQMPDEAAGRDRLSENERKPMEPGVSDSDHS